MLSRVAENLFWMSRYLERAENVARLLDIGLYLELDAASLAVEDGSAPVEIALAHPRLPRGVSHGPSRRPTATLVLGLSDLRPDQPPVDPEHDRPGPRKRPRHAGEPGRRRLERGQPALPVPLRPAGPAAVPRRARRRSIRRSSSRASSSTAWSRTRCRATRSIISSSWAATSSGST